MNDQDRLLRAALRYAALGWPVFPLWPRSKDPATARGFKDATTDAARIRVWWQRHPDHNIGLAIPPGLLAIDVDAHAHADGRPWAADRPALLPPTVTNCTSGGGWQGLYRVPADTPLAQRDLAPGVNVRAPRKGYIVLPPSVHPSGIRYAWAPGAGPHEIAPTLAPADLLAALAPEPRHPLDALAAVVQACRPPSTPPRGLIAFARAGVGQGNRNACGFWLANRLLDNSTDAYEAWRLMECYAANCMPPLSTAELRKLWRSAEQTPRRAPRVLLRSPAPPPDHTASVLAGLRQVYQR